ncbi:MAG TPA: SCP2 sterol-binding domain-containing protein [Methylophilaceae bacterium]|nr:SCP2 sterol-binding domain-containing protein [Methylophilaceae bacterium]
MFEPLITRLLNHLVDQNSWAREQLKPFAGKTVAFRIPPARISLTVLEDGGLAAAGEAAIVSAKVSLPPSVAMRLLAGDANAETLVSIEGDTELATTLSKVLRNMSWEYEEDLSKLVGDIPAHEIADFGRKTVSEVRKQSLNIAEMFTEYWQEEQPMIAKKRHIQQFMQEVERLRDDVERLEKRMDRLSTHLPSSASPENS